MNVLARLRIIKTYYLLMPLSHPATMVIVRVLIIARLYCGSWLQTISLIVSISWEILPMIGTFIAFLEKTRVWNFLVMKGRVLLEIVFRNFLAEGCDRQKGLELDNIFLYLWILLCMKFLSISNVRFSWDIIKIQYTFGFVMVSSYRFL